MKCSEQVRIISYLPLMFEYARLYFEENMQMWVDAEDSLGF